MNWAASHVADRKEFCQIIETKRFSKAESGQEKEIISQKKKKKMHCFREGPLPKEDGRVLWDR